MQVALVRNILPQYLRQNSKLRIRKIHVFSFLSGEKHFRHFRVAFREQFIYFTNHPYLTAPVQSTVYSFLSRKHCDCFRHLCVLILDANIEAYFRNKNFYFDFFELFLQSNSKTNQR
jgi:hypothetical protein